MFFNVSFLKYLVVFIGRKLAFSTRNNYAVARFILNKYEAKELGRDFYIKQPPMQYLGSIREKRQQLEQRIEECKELLNKRK